MTEQRIYSEHLGEAYQLFHEGILALADVEQNGMRIDVEYILQKNIWIDKKIQKLENVIYESEFFADWKRSQKVKVNIYSPVQLSKYLYEKLGHIPTKQTTGGGGSTDEETLGRLNIPELNTLLEIKKLQKVKNTYLAGFLREQVDGFVHPFFNLHLARSYRSSSNNPNLQNVPIRDEEIMKIIRQAIFPRIGNQILEFDFKQLEVGISACVNLDPTLMNYLETGGDMHEDLAIQIFNLKEFDSKKHKELRKAAKNGFVFPQFYGDYYVNNAKGLAIDWCKLTKGKWKKGEGVMVGNEHVSDILIRSGIKEYGTIVKDEKGYIKKVTGFLGHLKEIEDDFWGNRFKVYKQWKEDWWKAYQKNGYFVSKTGFIFKGVMSKNDATNYPVQGAAFHVLLWCLIQANKWFKDHKMETRIVGEIHDSIILDVYPPERDEVVRIMKRIMEVDVRKHWSWICVPLRVDLGECCVDGSWATKQEIKI